MSFHKSCFEQKVIGVKTIDEARAFNKKHEDVSHIPNIKIRKLREKIIEIEKKIDKNIDNNSCNCKKNESNKHE